MNTKNLSKMGTAKVFITTFQDNLCIQKEEASPVEISFYTLAASQLEGVNTPRLMAVQGSNLFIEYIPNSINLKELLDNRNTLEQLANIHRSNYQPTFSTQNHKWTSEATESALLALELPKVTQDYFRRIQCLSRDLFEHKTLISGDSNDGNWGLRNNGELVLFDWERFGFGSPAIDLAPLVSGMGTMSEYESIVNNYVNYNSALPCELLIKHLVLAKSWLVIEVTNILVNRGKPEAKMYINWYRKNLPSWLESVEKTL